MERRRLAPILITLTLCATYPGTIRTGMAEQATPQSQSAPPLPPPSEPGLVLDQTLPDTRTLAQASLAHALRRARHTALSEHPEHMFARARTLLHSGEDTELEALLRAFIQHHANSPDRTAEHASARLMLARLYLGQQREHEAITTLTDLSGTPIDDHVQWTRARALERAERYNEAIPLYEQLAADPQSFLIHRARARRAHALYHARRWDDAIQALQETLRLYPDYPRKHLLLTQLASALDRQRRYREAGAIYQTLWYDYPFRKEGRLARVRLDQLGAAGRAPAPRSRKWRYAQFRHIRWSRHWDTARALLQGLEKETREAEGPHSELLHRIWFQLGMGSYQPKDYKTALHYFTLCSDAYEQGHRKGLNPASFYKYKARTLARLGRLTEALKALDLAYRKKPRTYRLERRASFLKAHGRYAAALSIYKKTKPARWLTSWDGVWLLYKTREFDEAYDGLMELAAKQRKRSRTRAKYLYWAARTKERQRKPGDARDLFRQVTREHPGTYYAVQATNRLDDMERRARTSNAFSAQTELLIKGTREALDAMEAPGPGQNSTPRFESDLRAAPRLIQPIPRATTTNTAIPPLRCATNTAHPRSFACIVASAVGQTTPNRRPRHKRAPLTAPIASSLAPPRPPLNEEPIQHTRNLPPYHSRENERDRVTPVGDARIYWEGRDQSTLAFARQEAGEVIGPVPETMTAYDERSHIGGLARAVKQAGALFPRLRRARWLHRIGMHKEARWEARDVALEFNALRKMKRPTTEPHQLKRKRMTPLVDNRKRRRATWGFTETTYRWPVPEDTQGQTKLLARQQEIHDQRNALRPVMLDALKEAGDYYIVRTMTMRSGVYGRKRTMQTWPRAFPEQVIPAARRYGINPYLIWGIITIESTYNPDSISWARAIGLMQVIPRTGYKTAQLLGEEHFGHDDLLDEDVAIRHGAFYLSQLVRKFHGQEFFAIAGYNGGPHRIADLIDQRGNMPMDEFVEEIPYPESRNYVKKVTRYIARYLSLYEGVDRLYVGQNIRREFTYMPNF